MMMKYLFCLLFLVQAKNCKSETPVSKVLPVETVKVEKQKKNNYLINSVDKNAIGKKIEDGEQVKLLKTTLKAAFDRQVEKPYMWDVFVSSNDTLLQFYHYKDFPINGSEFKSYYIKINYEDAVYQAILLVNHSSNSEYNSMIVYEDLDSEEKYQRTAEVKGDKVKLLFKGGNPAENQIFQVKNGLFLDYFESQSVDRKWGKKEPVNSNEVFEYQLKGKTNNHLKNGYWIEKKYSMEYGRNIIEDGNYIDGIKDGDWNYSPEGPVDMIKKYDKGKEISKSYP